MDMFIDGAWTATASGATRDVRNPATGAVIDTVPWGTADDADRAVQAAAAAFTRWRKVPVEERARLQHRAAEAMRAASGEIGRLLCLELGRPLKGAVAEVRRAADLLDVYAEEGVRIHGELRQSTLPGEKVLVSREPVGVVVAITPFNYPINLLVFKLGAALIAGCTVVAKPADDTPLSTLALAGVLHEAGIPAGVFNVVTGRGSEIGSALIGHRIPRKVAFTGGTQAGKKIAALAAQTMKRVTLELGGQCPAIVRADADLDVAARAIVNHAFANSGQFCYRVNRVYAQRAIYEPLLARLAEHAGRLTVGDGFAEDVAMGPLVNEKIFANAYAQIVDAEAKGARILTGGRRLTGGAFDLGFFLPATIVADADHGMKVMREETFGPVLGVMPYDSDLEAIERANDTLYGLAGFVFSGDVGIALTMADAIEAGSIWINDIHRSRHDVPFGGVKESGVGREKGRYGVEAYLEYKTTYLTYRGVLA